MSMKETSIEIESGLVVVWDRRWGWDEQTMGMKDLTGVTKIF